MKKILFEIADNTETVSRNQLKFNEIKKWIEENSPECSQKLGEGGGDYF